MRNLLQVENREYYRSTQPSYRNIFFYVKTLLLEKLGVVGAEKESNLHVWQNSLQYHVA